VATDFSDWTFGTRFAFFENEPDWRNRATDWRNYLSHRQLVQERMLDNLPKLVMAIILEKHAGLHDSDKCHLRLYRPLSVESIAIIMKTPLRHVLEDHSRCRGQRLPPDEFPQDCMRVLERKEIRSVDYISRISLAQEGEVLQEASEAIGRISTDVRLAETSFESAETSKEGRMNLVTSIFQCLKLPAMRARRDVEDPLEAVPAHDLPQVGSGCLFDFQQSSNGLHIAQALSQQETEALCQKVRILHAEFTCPVSFTYPSLLFLKDRRRSIDIDLKRAIECQNRKGH
jgi:hypothetical protein